MNSNTLTTIDKLKVGDIFYKHSDKKKGKLEVHKIEPGRIVCIQPHVEKEFRDKEFLQKWLKPDLAVVFLRSTAEAVGMQ